MLLETDGTIGRAGRKTAALCGASARPSRRACCSCILVISCDTCGRLLSERGRVSGAGRAAIARTCRNHNDSFVQGDEVAFRRENSATEAENVNGNGHDALAHSRDNDEFEIVTRLILVRASPLCSLPSDRCSLMAPPLFQDSGVRCTSARRTRSTAVCRSRRSFHTHARLQQGTPAAGHASVGRAMGHSPA